MRKTVCGLAVYLLTLGAPTSAQEDPARALLVLQRGACARQCPVYRVTLFGDGSFTYEGLHNVRRKGVLPGKVPRETVAELLESARALGVQSVDESKLSCGSADGDSPFVTLTVSASWGARTLLHHYACRTPESERWKQFERRVDEKLNLAPWFRQGAK
jgi:hypothetical protein